MPLVSILEFLGIGELRFTRDRNDISVKLHGYGEILLFDYDEKTTREVMRSVINFMKVIDSYIDFVAITFLAQEV